MENTDKKCACGMLLNEKTRCSCNPEVCVHCCKCAPDCQCVCREKKEKTE